MSQSCSYRCQQPASRCPAEFADPPVQPAAAEASNSTLSCLMTRPPLAQALDVCIALLEPRPSPVDGYGNSPTGGARGSPSQVSPAIAC